MESATNGREIFYFYFTPYLNTNRQYPLGLTLQVDLKRSDGDKNRLMKPVVSHYVTPLLLINI